MEKFKKNYIQIFAICFMIWTGYCLYHISQKDRYKISSQRSSHIIDSHDLALENFALYPHELDRNHL